MAPVRPSRLNLQASSIMQDRQHHQDLCCSTTTTLASDLEFDSSTLSPRHLYAQSFDRTQSSLSLQLPPTTRIHRKNMKDMTGYLTTEEEFEALPIAVRKKYFSTLERLRFAESSRSNALNELPAQRNKKSILAERRGINTPVLEPRRSPSRRLRKLSLSRRRSTSVTNDEAADGSSWFLTLPEKIKKREFTREEQVVLAGRLRQSVILDAADEAYSRMLKNRQSSPLSPLYDSEPSTPDMESIMQLSSTDASESAAFYESFRWMDEDQNLDLKLDNYHANLDGAVIPNSESIRKPTFRRTMSISKMPFGRNSMTTPRSPKFEPGHIRQSKTLSLIAPKHTMQNSISSIDPNATHYQDPEARLKLRVYLASPQKFDEAIEFGFPSMDGVPVVDDKENRPPRSRDATGASTLPSTARSGLSFLLSDIDTASLFEDDTSMMDPDSPLTPLDKEMGFRHRPSPMIQSSSSLSDFTHLGISKPTVVKRPSDTYTHASAGSREMTLRMTLTRPDLRADENAIYGWQSAPTMSPLQEEPVVAGQENGAVGDMRGPFEGPDGWGLTEKDSSVVKRFWTKIRSQRKSA